MIDQELSQEEFHSRLLKRLRPIQIPAMQQEHLRLVEIISELFVCVKGLQQGRPTPEKETALEKTLNELKGYALMHFKNEEAVMARLDFPFLAEHKKIHQKFVAGLLSVENKMKTESVVYVIDLLHLTISWLFDHINSQDMQYSRFSMGEKVQSATPDLAVKRPKEKPAYLKSADSTKKKYRESLQTRLPDVGVALFNQEHRELLDQIIALHELVEELGHRRPDEDDWKKIEKTINFLAHYCVRHFSSEERLMSASHYAGLEQHKEEHRHFTAKVAEFSVKLKENKEVQYVVDLVFYLLEWFFMHTSRTDVRYKGHLTAAKGG